MMKHMEALGFDMNTSKKMTDKFFDFSPKPPFLPSKRVDNLCF